MNRFTHILSTVCLAFATMLVLSCSGDNYAGEPAPDAPVTLGVRLSVVDGASRAGGAADGIDRVEQLRIVILRQDGTVEVNRLVDFTYASVEDYKGYFKVKSGEDKTIYAIANPGSTGFDFADYPEGATGMGEALESWAYTFDAAKPIAMSDSRVIAKEQLIADQRTEVELSLVRVATKFTVEITNSRFDEVTVKGFSVSSLNDKHYLMPHFTGTDGCHIINDKGLSGFDFGDKTEMHWSDWLALAVDESQQKPDDVTLADKRGWIMKYALPSGAAHTQRDFELPDNPVMQPDGKLTLPTQYFGESRYGILSESTFGNGAAAEYEQSYRFTLALSSTDSREDKTFEDVKLPNLRALFRNTHVRVHLTLLQDRVLCYVSVVPYVVITLNPGFGWDNLPNQDTNPDPSVPGKREEGTEDDPTLVIPNP